MFKFIILISLTLNLYSLTLNQDTWYKQWLLSGVKCDKLYSNKILTSCYNYAHKGPIYVTYTIDGSVVDKKNIKKRGNWHTIRNMKKINKVFNKDYLHNGYDKGHLAFDRAFDWAKVYRDQTYILGINCVPQTPRFNRYYWRAAESYAVSTSKIFGHINIIDYIKYGNKTIGNHVGVPSTMYKIIYNDKFKRCFKYNNVFKFNKTTSISNFVTSCKSIEKEIRNK